MREGPVTDSGDAQHTEMGSAPKTRLLLVLPIVPWPIRRNGYSLRFAPIVDYLSQRYVLDVLVLSDEDEVIQPMGPLQRCHSLVVNKVPISSLPSWLRKIRTAYCALSPWGAPPGSLGYATRRLERMVLNYLELKSYSVVIWAAGHLDTACRIRKRYPGTRFIIDVVDSPTLRSSRAVSTDPILRAFTP